MRLYVPGSYTLLYLLFASLTEYRFYPVSSLFSFQGTLREVRGKKTEVGFLGCFAAYFVLRLFLFLVLAVEED